MIQQQHAINISTLLAVLASWLHTHYTITERRPRARLKRRKRSL